MLWLAKAWQQSIPKVSGSMHCKVWARVTCARACASGTHRHSLSQAAHAGEG